MDFNYYLFQNDDHDLILTTDDDDDDDDKDFYAHCLTDILPTKYAPQRAKQIILGQNFWQLLDG